MAMLNVGQFEHALNELLAWLDKTDETVDDISSTFGDPKQIEIELAKLKVRLLCWSYHCHLVIYVMFYSLSTGLLNFIKCSI